MMPGRISFLISSDLRNLNAIDTVSAMHNADVIAEAWSKLNSIGMKIIMMTPQPKPVTD